MASEQVNNDEKEKEWSHGQLMNKQNWPCNTCCSIFAREERVSVPLAPENGVNKVTKCFLLHSTRPMKASPEQRCAHVAKFTFWQP